MNYQDANVFLAFVLIWHISLPPLMLCPINTGSMLRQCIHFRLGGAIRRIYLLFHNLKQNITMGCESSNLTEVMPVEEHQIPDAHPHDSDPHHSHPAKPVLAPASVTSHGKAVVVTDKENKQPLKMSIKLSKAAVEPTKEEQAELTKRKSRSEYRIAEEVMNETTNVHKQEEKKKSLIISEKGKTHSAREVKEKTEVKQAEYVGPSTHSIPAEQPSAPAKIVIVVEKVPEDLTTPIVVEKQGVSEGQKMAEEPAAESLSEELLSQRSARTMKSMKSMKSFKFEVYVESQAEISSKTEKFNNKLEIFIEKEEVAKYLQMIEFGEKEEILGKLYEELQKKEEWNEIQIASSKSCEPMVVVVTEQGVTLNQE